MEVMGDQVQSLSSSSEGKEVLKSQKVAMGDHWHFHLCLPHMSNDQLPLAKGSQQQDEVNKNSLVCISSQILPYL
jgi:hypothetical protein